MSVGREESEASFLGRILSSAADAVLSAASATEANAEEGSDRHSFKAGSTTPLRVWELDANSTRYDQLVAAPSDETLHVMWTVWSAITFSLGVLVLVVFLGIVNNKRI